MSILEYKKDVYQKKYSDHLIADFNHGPLASGDIDKAKAKEIIQQLNRQSQGSISFDESRISDTLVGGSCSAIALKVAKAALDGAQLSECVKQLDKMTYSKSTKARLEKVAVRSLQTAFNTITIDRNRRVNDIGQEKIKALASYYCMTVKRSYGEIKIDDNLERELHHQLDELDPGVYLMRVIQYEDNHKGEVQGHSTVYVKNGHDLYFDTQLGLYDQTEPDDLIYNSLKSAHQRFKIDSLRFHQLS